MDDFLAFNIQLIGEFQTGGISLFRILVFFVKSAITFLKKMTIN